MKYEGQLYGKVGGRLIELEAHSTDYDRMKGMLNSIATIVEGWHEGKSDDLAKIGMSSPLADAENALLDINQIINH